MSDQTVNSTGIRLRGDMVVLAVVALMAVAAIFYVLSQRQQELRRSPAGMDGLEIWLSSRGHSAQAFSGGWPLSEDTVGLLVVPLYDTDLGNDKEWPTTREELLLQQDEYDLNLSVVRSKIAQVPTLVVLPKWRSGLRLTGIAHPALLDEAGRIERLMQSLTGDNSASLLRATVPFLDFDTRFPDAGGEANLTATIYAAQVMDVPGCEPVIGDAGAVLLARCTAKSPFESASQFYLLSDPDLLSNHGLRLGDNARIASAIADELVEDGAVVVDYSRRNWLIAAAVETDDRERSWADLGRFFSPPFTVLWMAAALLFGLLFWRAAIRTSPVMDAQIGLGAGKVQAVKARARLMRMSNQDGAMMPDYAKVRIAALVSRLFGPAQALHYASEENFIRYVERTHPAEVAPLKSALQELRNAPARMSVGRALGHVEELENVLERIADDT